jgi:hypothetical protein
VLGYMNISHPILSCHDLLLYLDTVHRIHDTVLGYMNISHPILSCHDLLLYLDTVHRIHDTVLGNAGNGAGCQRDAHTHSLP